MKRPWRNVVGVAQREGDVCHHRWEGGMLVHKRKTVNLWRLHLKCGHYVDVRRHNGMPPLRRKCHLCQHGHVPAAVAE